MSISYDSVAILSAFSKQRGVTFPLLSDVGSNAIKAYGILNPYPAMAFGPDKDDPAVQEMIRTFVSAVGARQEMIGVPFPGTFVVDRRGRVTARYFEDFYIERNTVSSLLVKLGGDAGASVAGTKVSTAHLDVTSYVSDPEVAPGNRFSIVLDVQPHAHLHVYAPGAEAKGYRVISLEIDEDPRFGVSPVTYPEAEMYHFKPLNEDVPVYLKPFRLTSEVLLYGSPQAQARLADTTELTIKGQLRYQACDDKICYTPVSVPISLPVKLRTLIRERPTVTPQ